METWACHFFLSVRRKQGNNRVFFYFSEANYDLIFIEAVKNHNRKVRQRDRYFPENLGKHVTDKLPFK